MTGNAFEGFAPLFIFLLGCLAVCFPLGIYCLILARLNRGPHPVLLSGTLDFAALLFGTSGLLLFLGPSLLTGFHYRWREVWLLLNFHTLRGLRDHREALWTAAWYLYFIVLLVGAVGLLWRRRRGTAIYNIEPSVFDGVLTGVLDRLELDWLRMENRVVIRSPQPVGLLLAVSATEPNGPAARDPAEADPRPLTTQIEVEGFAPLRHVTLHWSGTPANLRRRIEAELESALAEIHSGRNLAAGFFLCLGTGIIFALFLFTLAIQIWRIKSELF